MTSRDFAPLSFINLDAAVERRAFVETQAAMLGLAIERHAALRADDVADAEFRLLGKQWERPITRVELAVFLSHKKLWEAASRSPRGLVILEDDVVLSPRLKDFIVAPAPPFDLVNLEFFNRRKFFNRSSACALPASHRISPVVRDKAGAAAYWLSPGGAQKLLRDADRYAAPADAFLFRSGRLTVAQIEPALAIQAHILASLGVDPGFTTSTQIHQPRQRLPLDPKNTRFHGRRLTTQLRLLSLHAGRGSRFEFRKPLFDLTEFRAVAAELRRSQSVPEFDTGAGQRSSSEKSRE